MKAQSFTLIFKGNKNKKVQIKIQKFSIGDSKLVMVAHAYNSSTEKPEPE